MLPCMRRPDPPLPAVFTHVQARVAGLTSQQVQRRVASGRWRRLRQGCYCLATVWQDGDRTRRHLLATWAAVLSTGADHWVSHASAAVLHGLPMPFTDVPVVLTHPPGTATRYLRGLEIMAASVDEEHRTRRRGLAVTSEARSVADCLRHLGTIDAVAVADAAVRRTPQLRPVIAAVLESMRAWPYSEHARDSWHHVDGRRESPAESWSYAAMLRQRLPLPEPQVLVYDERGVFVARVDAWWDEWAVVGEVDGLVKYQTAPGADRRAAGRRLVKEKRREDALRRLDARVVRWGTHDLRDERRWAADLRAELSRGDRSKFRGTVRTTPWV